LGCATISSQCDNPESEQRVHPEHSRMSNRPQQQRQSGMGNLLLVGGLAAVAAWFAAPRHVEKAVNMGTSTAKAVIENAVPDDQYGVKEALLKVPSLADKAASLAGELHAKFVKQEADIEALKAKVAENAAKVASHKSELEKKLADLKQLKAGEANTGDDERAQHALEIKKLEDQLAQIKKQFATAETGTLFIFRLGAWANKEKNTKRREMHTQRLWTRN